MNKSSVAVICVFLQMLSKILVLAMAGLVKAEYGYEEAGSHEHHVEKHVCVLIKLLI